MGRERSRCGLLRLGRLVSATPAASTSTSTVAALAGFHLAASLDGCFGSAFFLSLFFVLVEFGGEALGLSRNRARGFGGVHLLAALDDVGLLPVDRGVGVDGDGDA